MKGDAITVKRYLEVLGLMKVPTKMQKLLVSILIWLLLAASSGQPATQLAWAAAYAYENGVAVGGPAVTDTSGSAILSALAVGNHPVDVTYASYIQTIDPTPITKDTTDVTHVGLSVAPGSAKYDSIKIHLHNLDASMRYRLIVHNHHSRVIFQKIIENVDEMNVDAFLKVEDMDLLEIRLEDWRNPSHCMSQTFCYDKDIAISIGWR